MVFLILFCLYPLILIMKYGIVNDEGRITLRYLQEVLTDRIYLKIIRFTVVQAFISAAVTIIMAFPGAYLLSKYRFPGKSVIIAATTVPFVLPSLVLAVGFLGVFGPQGTINGWIEDFNGWYGKFLPLLEILYTNGGIKGWYAASIPLLDILYTKRIIILAHIFFNFPIALRIIHSRYGSMDPDLENAARSMGADRIRTFFKVTLPQMRYSLLSSFSLVFTFCLLSLGVILVIGGLNHTLEVEVLSRFYDLKPHQGGALVIIESIIVLLTTMVYLWSSSREGSRADVALGKGISKIPGRKPNLWSAFLIFVYIALVVIVIFGPLISVGQESLSSGGSGGGLTLEWYGKVLSRQGDKVLTISPLGAIINSLLFGTMTMLLAVPLSIVTAHMLIGKKFRSKWALDVLLLFPLGASSVALGYGLVKAFSGAPLQLAGTWYIVVLVHTVIAYPLGARAVYSSLKSIPPDLVKAARSMGAGNLEAYVKVELPLMMPGILIAAVFAFAISIGELGATLMVSKEAYMTMPVFLYKMIEGGGRELGPMNAFAVILMGITFLSFMAIEIIKHVFMKWGVDR
jgi:thiamine transport system permease protein